MRLYGGLDQASGNIDVGIGVVVTCYVEVGGWLGADGRRSRRCWRQTGGGLQRGDRRRLALEADG